jgi:hypothetical protein
MKQIELSQKELKLIINSLNYISNNYPDAPEYKINLISNLSLNINRIVKITTKFSERESHIITGSINNYVLDKNQFLIQKNSFELLTLDYISNSEKIEEVCLAYNVLNKISNKKYTSFNRTIEILKKLNKTKSIYYSKNSNGQFYKIGLEVDKNIGIKIDGYFSEENIQFHKINKDQFMFTAKPEFFLSEIKNYYLINKPNNNEEKILSLLEKTFLKKSPSQ